MAKIVVTGGAGRLGRLAVGEILSQGHEVLAVDSATVRDLPCRFLTAEMTDAGAVYDVLRGADAVLHLAAVPGPNNRPPSTTFANNVLSTHLVVEAATALGVGKVVFASSVFALGWAEDPRRYWPRYVPVDEEHPLTPFEGYGLSKAVGEEICSAASRRTGLATVSLRIMNVIQPDGYHLLPWASPTPERPVRFVMWPYVDARDAARACRLALETQTTGHEAFYIAAADIRFDQPTRDLLAEFAPQVEIRGGLRDRESVISIRKARELIGYEPHFTWQNESRRMA